MACRKSVWYESVVVERKPEDRGTSTIGNRYQRTGEEIAD
jgi:hypothetical protein